MKNALILATLGMLVSLSHGADLKGRLLEVTHRQFDSLSARLDSELNRARQAVADIKERLTTGTLTEAAAATARADEEKKVARLCEWVLTETERLTHDSHLRGDDTLASKAAGLTYRCNQAEHEFEQVKIVAQQRAEKRRIEDDDDDDL